MVYTLSHNFKYFLISVCYVKCQNVLVHLLEYLSFRLRCPQFFIIKICFTSKVNSVCGVGRDTRNLCHKFNSQGPTLRILGLWIASPKSQGPSSRILGVRIPCPGSQGPWSQVLILDYAIINHDCFSYFYGKSHDI